MKISANALMFTFLFLGILFTVLAINFSDETIWNTTSIVFMVLATIEFAYVVRIFQFTRKIKNQMNKKK